MLSQIMCCGLVPESISNSTSTRIARDADGDAAASSHDVDSQPPLLAQPGHAAQPWGRYPWGAQRARPAAPQNPTPALKRATSLPAPGTAPEPALRRAVSFSEAVHYRVVERLPEWATPHGEQVGEEGIMGLRPVGYRAYQPSHMGVARGPAFAQRHREAAVRRHRLETLQRFQEQGLLADGQFRGTKEARENRRENARLTSSEGEKERARLRRGRFSLPEFTPFVLAFEAPVVLSDSDTTSEESDVSDLDLFGDGEEDADWDGDDGWFSADNDAVDDGWVDVGLDESIEIKFDDVVDGWLIDSVSGTEGGARKGAEKGGSEGLGSNVNDRDGVVVSQDVVRRSGQIAMWITTDAVDAAASAGEAEAHVTGAVTETKIVAASAATEGYHEAEEDLAEVTRELGCMPLDVDKCPPPSRPLVKLGEVIDMVVMAV